MTVFQEAADPSTPAERLAELAFAHPEVRPLVALHPAAYDGLLDWLDEHGDPNTKAAVAQRRGTAPAPVAPPANSYTAAVTGVAPVVAQAPATPRTPMAAATKRLLLLGGVAALVVAALVVTAIVVVPRLLAGGGGSAIRIASYGSEPVEAWTVDGADVVRDVDYSTITTLSQDRALVEWHGEDDDDDVLSLLDTRSGSLIWSEERSGLDEYDVVAADSSAVVFSLYREDGPNKLVSVSLADGSTIDSLTAQYIQGNRIAVRTLPTTLLIQDGDELALYSAGNLSTPRWTLEIDEDDSVTLAGSRIMVGRDVYATDTGAEQDWRADDDRGYYDYNGLLLSAARDESDEFAVLDPATGDERWVGDIEDGLSLQPSVILVMEGDDITALDPATGEERWKADNLLDGADFDAVEFVEAGILLLRPYGSGDDDSLLLDIRSGERFDNLDVGGSLDDVIGASSDILYYRAYEDDELRALDVRGGRELWSIDFDDLYFQFAGGNLIATDLEDTTLIHGYR